MSAQLLRRTLGALITLAFISSAAIHARADDPSRSRQPLAADAITGRPNDAPRHELARVIRRLKPKTGADVVAWSLDGKLLAAMGGLQERITLWDARSGDRLSEAVGDLGAGKALAFSIDGRFLLASTLKSTPEDAHSALTLLDVSRGTIAGRVVGPFPNEGAAEIGRADGAPSSIALKPDEEGSPYYRLKVKLTYKGEPQDFDIVVGCSVPVHHYDDLTYYSMVPQVFGRKLSDGKALLVRPPRACDGQTTANGRVQPDLLPLVAVYDDAETLAFGTAYLSEDAYESPLSLLKFGGATIEKATRREFAEFRRTQQNVVTRAMFFSHFSIETRQRMGLPIVATPYGDDCVFYLRFRLPDELRAILIQRWPKERPHYWIPNSFEDQHYLLRLINESLHLRSDGPRDTPRRPQLVGGGDVDVGFPTRAGGGFVISYLSQRFPGAYYPATYDDRADKWPSDPIEKQQYFAAHDTFDYVDIDFRGGLTKGFAYCASTVKFDRTLLVKKLIMRRVDDELIWANPALHLSGTSLPTAVFEQDEFLFLYEHNPLGPDRGDV